MKNLARLSLLLVTSTLIFNCSSENIETDNLSIEEDLTDRRGEGPETEEPETVEPETEIQTTTETKIEAEDYSSMSGIQTEASSEDTDNIGWVNNGDWLKFNDINLTGANSIDARVSSKTNGGAIEIRLGSTTGTLIGNLTVPNTGGWQSWETVSTSLTDTNGVYDVYFVFTGDAGYLFNVNWFNISAETTETETPITGLHAAYAEFDTDETDIYLSDSGDYVIIETTGYPNHTSPYWSEDHELYVAPTVADPNSMAPSIIDSRDASDVLTVAADPQLASSTTATGLSTIGIAISGAAIFNNEEGNGPLNAGTASGLDYAGAHIGPGVYHYHLEPLPMSDDDSNLIGVLADGFFIYGRKEYSTGTYPTDLDESGGHVGMTQYSDVPEYHYHMINEIYLDNYYILFEGPFQGTPNL